jgi:hypothetical protein
MRYSHVHMVVAPQNRALRQPQISADRVGIRACSVGVSGSASFDRCCGCMVVPTFAQAHNVTGSLLRLALVESRCAPADQWDESTSNILVREDLACHEAA